MVTWRKATPNGPTVYAVGDCKSSDVKPAAIGDRPLCNGSQLEELDTGRQFRLDAETGSWEEWTGSGGGCAQAMDDWSSHGL